MAHQLPITNFQQYFQKYFQQYFQQYFQKYYLGLTHSLPISNALGLLQARPLDALNSERTVIRLSVRKSSHY